eukprot:jgi/Tetstr1/453829/TSEL_003993.t2
MEALQTCKAALDGGLIGQADYDRVKDAWLRAQSLKAAFDAGFMSERDYDQVKLDFLASLGSVLSGGIGGASNGVAAPSAAPAGHTAHSKSHHSKSHHGHSAAKSHTPRAAPAPAAPRRSEPPTRSAPSTEQAPRAAPQPSARRATVAVTGSGASAGSGSEWHTGKNLPGKSMSGYSVDVGSVDAFMAMKAKSAFPWCLFKIQGSQVVVDTVGSGDYQDFLSALPPTDPRYAVYDFFLTSSEGRKLNKLVFVLWSPDGASVKNKMMYSSTKDFFKELLDGVSCDMHADDLDDISEQEMHSYVMSTMTRK